MTGFQFITDAKGRKTAAVIDLKKHSALWEDIEDVLVSRSRRHEKRIPFEKVKADLIASGKLRGWIQRCIRVKCGESIVVPEIQTRQ